MISDALMRLSGTTASATAAAVGQADVLAAGTYYSTYCVDLNSPTNVSGGTSTTQNRDIGEGEDLYVVFSIPIAFSGGTQVTMDVIVADNLAGTTNTLVVGTVGSKVTANLTLGAYFACRINPQLGTAGQRYLMARYTSTGAYTVGSIFADVTTDIYDSKKFYGSGFTVT
jgi:hypothetical protein